MSVIQHSDQAPQMLESCAVGQHGHHLRLLAPDVASRYDTSRQHSSLASTRQFCHTRVGMYRVPIFYRVPSNGY